MQWLCACLSLVNLYCGITFEVKGATTAALDGPEMARGPLMLQGDHGPVAFRNLRLKQLGGEGDKVRGNDATSEETVSSYASTTRGALHVKAVSARSDDWYMVFQNSKQLVPPGKPLLGSTVELAPGAYVVRVNRSERKVTIQAGKLVTLLVGELVVEAKKGVPGWYTPYQGKEPMLAANPPVLNSPIALFAGKYKVTYRMGGTSPPQDLGEVEIKPGRKTALTR